MNDDLKIVREDIQRLHDGFDTFRLQASLDISELKIKYKFQAKVFGAVSGFITTLIILGVKSVAKL